jgi:DNA-binding MurR/RpiR family transcriptional regulator
MDINATTGGLEPTNWAELAQVLGVSRNTIYRHRQAFGIEEFNLDACQLVSRSVQWTAKRTGRSHQTLVKFAQQEISHGRF